MRRWEVVKMDYEKPEFGVRNIYRIIVGDTEQ